MRKKKRKTDKERMGEKKSLSLPLFIQSLSSGSISHLKIDPLSFFRLENSFSVLNFSSSFFFSFSCFYFSVRKRRKTFSSIFSLSLLSKNDTINKNYFLPFFLFFSSKKKEGKINEGERNREQTGSEERREREEKPKIEREGEVRKKREREEKDAQERGEKVH